jgi:predicted transcriptional regulator
MSQYGLLKVLRVDERGTIIDGSPVSPVAIGQLGLEDRNDITLRLEVPAEATHPGGLTIFGRGFGNYGQDLQMRLYYKENSRENTDIPNGGLKTAANLIKGP